MRLVNLNALVMIKKIEQMEHPLGIRFFKIHVEDFASGHFWCVAYKFNGCIISSFVPNFNECQRVCEKAFGISPKWDDCSTLVPCVSFTGLKVPQTYSEFTEWLHSLRHTFKNV